MDISFFQEWKENKELSLVGLFCGHLMFSSWSMLGKWSVNGFNEHRDCVYALERGTVAVMPRNGQKICQRSSQI